MTRNHTKSPEYPLPCYLLDEEKLIANLKLIKSVREEAGVDIILAFKAFALWPIFPLIKKYMSGATASSLWEALLCQEEIGRKAHTYSPAYLPEDIKKLTELSSHLTVNSLEEYHRYKHIFKKEKVSIGLRVNPEYSTVKIDLYNPAAVGSRLGVSERKLRKYGLPAGIEGLHFHSLCESSAQDFKNTLSVFEKKFKKYFKQLKWVNFGGGHLMTRKGYDLDLLISTLSAFKRRHGLKVILEPGSAVAWQTGDLHARVLDIVENGEVKTAILDVSFTAHMPDTLEMPYRPEIEDTSPNGKYKYKLGGVSCLAGDVLDYYNFEAPLQVEDMVILKDMMHYTMVKTTMFNGVKHPSIAVKKKNDSIEVLRRFTYEDFKSRLG